MFFSYKAVKDGKVIHGKYEAGNKGQVLAYLKSQNMTPLDIGAGKDANTGISFNPKPKAKDLSMFCEQFCSLLRSGISIVEALRLLSTQTKNKRLNQAINESVVNVSEGASLATAMDRCKVFDDTFISLVRAGEESGSLDMSLERMGNQYKKDAEISASVKKALVYPIIVLLVALGVVIFMLLYIVPAFMEMFNDIGIQMPKITLMVVGASEWLQKNWVLALAVAAAVIIAIVAFCKSPPGKRIFSKLSLIVPGINAFVIKTHASKIARTLSTLLTAGMNVTEALTILEETLPNYYYKEAIREVKEEVLVGHPMSDKFIEKSKLFPPMLSHMVAVGEETGDLTAMLIKTAEYYDLEVETATESLMTLIQPMIILLLSGIVGVVLAAVLSPMVSLYSQLGDKL